MIDFPTAQEMSTKIDNAENDRLKDEKITVLEALKNADSKTVELDRCPSRGMIMFLESKGYKVVQSQVSLNEYSTFIKFSK
ncbi:MAG: hypothetical protein V3V00_15805 [Saprospiraceae bacterium]